LRPKEVRDLTEVQFATYGLIDKGFKKACGYRVLQVVIAMFNYLFHQFEQLRQVAVLKVSQIHRPSILTHEHT